VDLGVGDMIVIETPGGGGFGEAAAHGKREELAA
jgi:N-methylhydantoinase B/oxoprolinase/acetone carboxylase alpha subunit